MQVRAYKMTFEFCELPVETGNGTGNLRGTCCVATERVCNATCNQTCAFRPRGPSCNPCVMQRSAACWMLEDRCGGARPERDLITGTLQHMWAPRCLRSAVDTN